MNNLDGLHVNAKRGFDELGLELLRSVVTFHEPEREPRRSVEPDIFKARTVTDQDIIGDLHIG